MRVTFLFPSCLVKHVSKTNFAAHGVDKHDLKLEEDMVIMCMVGEYSN